MSGVVARLFGGATQKTHEPDGSSTSAANSKAKTEAVVEIETEPRKEVNAEVHADVREQVGSDGADSARNGRPAKLARVSKATPELKGTVSKKPGAESKSKCTAGKIGRGKQKVRRLQVAATVLTAHFASDTESEDVDYIPSSSEDDMVQDQPSNEQHRVDVDVQWERMQKEEASEASKRPIRKLTPLMQSLQIRHDPKKQPKDRSYAAIEKMLGNYGQVFEDGKCPAISAREVRRQLHAEEAAAQISSSNSAPKRVVPARRAKEEAASQPSSSSSAPKRSVSSSSFPLKVPAATSQATQSMHPEEATRNSTKQLSAAAGSSAQQPLPNEPRQLAESKQRKEQEVSIVERSHREWKETRITEEGLYNHQSVIEKQDFLSRVAQRESTAQRVEHRKSLQAAIRARSNQEAANKRLELAKVSPAEKPKVKKGPHYVFPSGKGI